MEKLALWIRFAIVIALAYYLFPFFIPFLFAILVVILFEPLVRLFEKKCRIRRLYGVVVLYTGFLVGSIFGVYFFLFKVITQLIDLAKKVPAFVEHLYTTNQEFAHFYSTLPIEVQHYLTDAFNSFSQTITVKFSDFAGDVVVSLLSFGDLFVAFIVFVVSMYLMGFQAHRLKDTFLGFFANGSTRKGVEIVLVKLKKAIIGFIQAQIILSLVVFLVTWAGVGLIGLPYPALSALIVMLIDLLPILGTGAAIVPWSAYMFLSGDFTSAWLLLVLFLVLTVIRRALEPKLLADTLGISALSSLIAMYIGFCVMGLTGMILGPALVIVIQALQEAQLINVKIKLKSQ